MKYFLALLMTLWLAISLTAAKGGKKMKKIKELEAKIDVLFGLRENLQMEKNIIHERFQEIEFALQTLTESKFLISYKFRLAHVSKKSLYLTLL